MTTEERPYPDYFEHLPPFLEAQYKAAWDAGWDGQTFPDENVITARIESRVPYAFYVEPSEEEVTGG